MDTIDQELRQRLSDNPRAAISDEEFAQLAAHILTRPKREDTLYKTSHGKLWLRDTLGEAYQYHRALRDSADQPTEPTLGMASCSDLARKHRVPQDALGKALGRFRASNDDGYNEVQTRRRNEPQYLYAELSVMPVIAKLKTRKSRPPKTSHGRRTKK